MNSKSLLIIAALAMGGCAVKVDPGTTDVRTFSVATVQASGKVAAVPGAMPKGATPLRIIHASSCQRFQWDPVPTRETALMLLKAKVLEQGGNGVAGITYTHLNMDIVQNCMGTITASGFAFVR